MFNIKYVKTNPNTFLIQYKKGQVKRQGSGLSFWYYAPTTSLVAIPTGSTEAPFIFKEKTQDFQEITVQGQVVYRVKDPEKLAQMMNFSLDLENDQYASEDPKKLNDRILNLVQVKTQNNIESLTLREAIAAAQPLVNKVTGSLNASEVLEKLGIEVVDLNILAIKPTPETARALESAVREQLLEEADDALYKRRNGSIDQERAIKENELNTELAIEGKQQQIKESKLQAEMALQEQRRNMKQKEMAANIDQEQQRQELVELSTENERKQADVKAYEIAATMDALSRIKPEVLEAMTMAKLDAKQLMALGLREFAGNVDKIGQMNISPDLIQAITGQLQGKG